MSFTGHIRVYHPRWARIVGKLRATVRISVGLPRAARRVRGAVARAAVKIAIATKLALKPGGVVLQAGPAVVVYPRVAKPVLGLVRAGVKMITGPDRKLIARALLRPFVRMTLAGGSAARRPGWAGLAVSPTIRPTPKTARTPGLEYLRATVRVLAKTLPIRRAEGRLAPAVSLISKPGRIVGRMSGGMTLPLKARPVVGADSVIFAPRITSDGDVRVTSDGDTRIRWERA